MLIADKLETWLPLSLPNPEQMKPDVGLVWSWVRDGRFESGDGGE